MNKWHKIVGIIVFAVIGIYELLLWAFAITDWEDTPLYNCINNLSVAQLFHSSLYVYLSLAKRR